MINLPPQIVTLDGAATACLRRLNDALGSALARNPRASNDELAHAWKTSAERLLELSDEVFLRLSWTCEIANMKEANFRHLHATGDKVFSVLRNPRYTEMFQDWPQEHKDEMKRCWNELDSQAKSLLPDLRTARPAATIIKDLQSALLTSCSDVGFTLEEKEAITSLLSKLSDVSSVCPEDGSIADASGDSVQ
jgi:hypothetical protein